ncbi:putative DNA-binding protein [Pseudonocardia sp. Ae706_Ps2]|nr:putative DNA-binding protein [Pseudonocardia sp. Ae706_Ps2]
MSTPPLSSARIALGAELRRHRLISGLPGHIIAATLKCDQSRISRIESGRVKATIAEVEHWLRATGAPSEEIAPLLNLATKSLSEKISWKGGPAAGWTAHRGDYIGLEREAKRSLVWQFSVLPELLQTPDYSHYLLVKIYSLAERQVRERIAMQIARQAALQHVQYNIEFVVAEHVLRQRVGGAAIMTSQLKWIASRATEPNIDLSILPSDVEMDLVPEPGTSVHFPSSETGTSIAIPEPINFTKRKISDRLENPARYIAQFRAYQRHSLRGTQACEFIEGLVREMSDSRPETASSAVDRNGE